MRSALSLLRLTVAGTILALASVGCGKDGPNGFVDPPGPAPAPQITSVSPAIGGTARETPLTIIGSGFLTGATLTIGGVSVPMALQNTTRAAATAPPHAPGVVDVVLTNPNGERAQLTGGFRYVDLPTRLDITGNLALQSIGDSAQLTATAALSDGTSVDVTRDAQWTSQFPWIATIGTDGRVTGRALGLTHIFVRYPTTNPSLIQNVLITVTPPGSLALGGRVREPGAGSVAGARVVHLDSGQSVDSNTDGYFVFGGLIGRPRLRVTRQGYEDSELDGSATEFFDAPLQRIVHLAAGTTHSGQLAPNDVTLNVGGETLCQPCRLIRVTTGNPGPAQVTLRWTGPSTLQIWVNGQSFASADGSREITADVTLGGGDTKVFVGRKQTETVEDYIPFSVAVRQ